MLTRPDSGEKHRPAHLLKGPDVPPVTFGGLSSLRSVLSVEAITERIEDRPPDWDEAISKLSELGVPKDPVARAQMVASLSSRDLMEMISGVHKALIAQDVHGPKADRAMKVIPVGSIKAAAKLTAPEDMQNTFTHARNAIFQLTGGLVPETTTDFLDRASNVAGMAVVVGHQFSDGNGRTARGLAYLIRNGMPDADGMGDFQGLTSHGDGRRTSFASFEPRSKFDPVSEPKRYFEEVAALDLPLQAGGHNPDYEHRSAELLISPFQAA